MAVLFFEHQSCCFNLTFFTSSSDVKQEEIINAVLSITALHFYSVWNYGGLIILFLILVSRHSRILLHEALCKHKVGQV